MKNERKRPLPQAKTSKTRRTQLHKIAPALPVAETQ
jgi:hypothetical protein